MGAPGGGGVKGVPAPFPGWCDHGVGSCRSRVSEDQLGLPEVSARDETAEMMWGVGAHRRVWCTMDFSVELAGAL